MRTHKRLNAAVAAADPARRYQLDELEPEAMESELVADLRSHWPASPQPKPKRLRTIIGLYRRFRGRLGDANQRRGLDS